MQTVQKEEKPVIYSAGATKVLRFRFPKGRECFHLHWHERIEILYVREGSFEYTRGNEKGVLKKGEALIIPPRTAHCAVAKQDVDYDVLMFDVRYFYNDTDICKSVLPAIFEGRAVFLSKTGDRDIISALGRICYSPNPGSLEGVAQIYRLLHLFITKGILHISDRPADMGAREIVQYIEEHFAQELTVLSLCEKFGYTAAHFCRKFKKATGLTPVAYIRIFRLEKAYRIIKEGGGQISEIAEKCGFTDSNYFTRCFTAHYKHPPTFYRFKNM